jgi:hypothetical protein
VLVSARKLFDPPMKEAEYWIMRVNGLCEYQELHGIERLVF